MYRGGIIIKSLEQIEAMARAGEVHARCMRMLVANCQAGVTSLELDTIAERFIRSQGATPTFKGYRGFPASICASPNSMVVHGIPDANKLADGDIFSIDIGVSYEGWVSDGACTVAIGSVSEPTAKLLEVTQASLHAGVAQAIPGNHLGDISNAVQITAEESGMGVIRSLVGHGVGREMHEDPQVPNFGRPGHGPRLEAGMVLAIEPMLTAGSAGIVSGDDGWAVYSEDGSMAAHFEFTVAITDDGPRILNPWHQ